MKTILSLLALACLVSCSQEVPNVPAASPVATAPASSTTTAPGQAATPQAERLDAAHFAAAPAASDCAAGKVTSARVSWDASALGASGVSIYVESPGNPRKLWMEGGAKGEATTGDWVFEGTRFTIQDQASGEVLATRMVPGIDCRG